MWNKLCSSKLIACVLLFFLGFTAFVSHGSVQESCSQTPEVRTAQDALELRISVSKTIFEAGSSVPLQIEIRNVSQKEIWIGLSREEQLGMPLNLPVFVRDKSRRKVPPEGYILHESPFGMPGPHDWWAKRLRLYSLSDRHLP